MLRNERLRRVLMLCGSFVRNLAYYRAGWSEEHRHLLGMNNGDFWRVVNGNFIDTCVLEWCKLFGEKKGEFHWKKIVSNPVSFKAGLLLQAGLDEYAFNKEINTFRQYRDKWVAHLDTERTGFIPALEVAKKAVWFYYARVKQEAESRELVEFTRELDRAYEQCEREAKEVYRIAAGRPATGSQL
jgi:hypothetical protein